MGYEGVAAIVYRGPMAKLFLWTIFTHDFELYPFDRKLSYDFVQFLVILAHMSNFQDQRKANRANSVHEGLAICIVAIKCRGRYTCSKLGRKKWAEILFSP